MHRSLTVSLRYFKILFSYDFADGLKVGYNYLAYILLSRLVERKKSNSSAYGRDSQPRHTMGAVS